MKQVEVITTSGSDTETAAKRTYGTINYLIDAVFRRKYILGIRKRAEVTMYQKPG